MKVRLGMDQVNDKPTDGITSGIEARKQRGLQIAALARVVRRNDGRWRVPSESGHDPYTVEFGDQPHCTCADHETRGCCCKHIYAVEYVIRRERSPAGSTSVTEKITATKTRKTYPQNWSAYNLSQQREKDEFQRLLADLCRNIEDRPQTGRGRRSLRLGDAVFACASALLPENGTR
jgi:hypothetical protein